MGDDRRHALDDPWIGDGTALATARDVIRALSLFAAACVINAFAVAALALAVMA